LSVQFTPGPYAVPGSRPDTPLTQISNFRPVEPYLSINDQDPGQVAVSSHNGVRVTSNDGGSFSNVGTFPGSTGGGSVGGEAFGDSAILREALANLPPIQQFQVIQRTVHALEVKLVVEEEETLRKYLAREFGYPFACTFSYVKEIPRSPGGKFEEFRSEL
jgi:hypothetical protein